MERREGGVKRLDAERGGVVVPALRAHQRDGAEAADVAVMEGASVVETQVQRGVAALAVGEGMLRVLEQQRAGEAGLHHEPLARRQVEHDELRAPPGTLYRGAGEAARKVGGAYV